MKLNTRAIQQLIRHEITRLVRIIETDSIEVVSGDHPLQPSVRLKPGGGILSGPTGLETTGAHGDRRKPALTSRTTSAAVQVDPVLADIPLEADKGYEIDGMLPFTAVSVVPGAKIALTIPSGAVMDIAYFWMKGTTLFGSGLLTASGTASARIEVDNLDVTVLWLTGTVLVDETEGEIDLLWSQFASSGDALTLGRGAYLSARLMGVPGPAEA